MATGKRASMREGPLADLFRKTSTDEPARPDPVAQPPASPAPPLSRRCPRAASRGRR